MAAAYRTKDEANKGYIVMVEWDGAMPPTSWYNRLHKEGLYVRGSKDQSPLLRRQNHGVSGVVYQEGCMIVQSEGLARSLASYATEQGAVNVTTGLVRLGTFIMSEADKQVLENLNAVWGRRGRRSEMDKGTYVITCMEQAHSWKWDGEEKPVVCPDCGSPKITWRKLIDGDESSFAIGSIAEGISKAGSLLNLWYDTRFANGRFEIPTTVDATNRYTNHPIDKSLHAIPAIVETLSSSKIINHNNDGWNLGAVLEMLDAAYCLQTLSAEERLNKRLLMLEDYYKQGGKAELRLAVPAAPDMVDIAATLPYNAYAQNHIASTI